MRLAVEAFLRADATDWGTPEIIGFHGQTVLHRPHVGLTVQTGRRRAARVVEPALPVVYDMRANDMVHGGQGAPLVPAYHAALAR